ncbi:MAG TPA: DNA polymerase IV [Longimicrobiales bacterium]|nr:DNA polymerase IV [Longimicrobiales bacterium]
MRKILLADCDAYFVQVARLEDPEGAGKEPLLLVGGRAENRGVITSASYECRKFGVRSGMPTSQALRLCPRAVLVGVPRGALSRKHREIREVLLHYTPLVEAASIDEFYIDLTGTEALHRTDDVAELARRIREHVLSETEISISIGGGTSRVVAKTAAKKAKPAGVYVVDAGKEVEYMSDLELAAIPGVGPKFQEKLRSYGLIYVRDLLPFDEKALSEWFGDGTGGWLYDRVRGTDDGEVEPHSIAKSISRDETFARDLTADDALLNELARLTADATSDLRSRDLRARTIVVKVRDADFTTRQARHTVEQALETDRAIYDVAKELFFKLRNARRGGVRLLGVSLAGFTDQHGVEQLGLFGGTSTRETDRDRQLSRVVDKLRNKFGAESIVTGRTLPR